MSLAGIDTTYLKGHSMRGAEVSKAKSRGAYPNQLILRDSTLDRHRSNISIASVCLGCCRSPKVENISGFSCLSLVNVPISCRGAPRHETGCGDEIVVSLIVIVWLTSGRGAFT